MGTARFAFSVCNKSFIKFIADIYSKNIFFRRSIFSSIEVSGMSFTQSIEAPLTVKDTAVLGGELGIKNGIGSGSINFAVRRLVSPRGWFEVEVGAGNGPTLAFRGYRSLTKRIFFNGGTVLQFNPNEIRPGLVGSM